MWVKYKDGREEFQEVKYSSELHGKDDASLRSQEQIRRETEWCKLNNFNFIVVTELDICKSPFYINNLDIIVSRLRRYQPIININFYKKRIYSYFKRVKNSTIKDIIESEMLPISLEFDYLCYLHSTGVITIDIIKRPLNEKSEVVFGVLSYK